MRDGHGRVLPDFIIVGAMRGGSTALAQALMSHPDVYLPPNELWFFSNPARFRKGIDKYCREFRSWAGQPVVGEKTAAYSYRPAQEPSVPECIVRALPDVKIVWILRDPVSRAYSQYWHAVRSGVEPLPFERAVVERKRPDWRAYRDRSLYVRQVEHFLEFIPRSRMHFVKFEQFAAEPPPALRDLYTFLGADPGYQVAASTLMRAPNPGRVPRSRFLAQVGAKLRWNRPGHPLGWLRKLNSTSLGYPALAPQMRAELAEFFAPHNAALAELVDFDISGWGTPSDAPTGR